MEVLTLVKEFTVGLAWPVVTLLLVLGFKREARMLLSNLADRFRSASSIELPGVKAFFTEERLKVIEVEAKEIATRLYEQVPQLPANTIEEHVRSALVGRELSMAALAYVVAQGRVSRPRLSAYVKGLSIQDTGSLDEAVSQLLQVGYLTEESGLLAATEQGVRTARAGK